jgi:hypothetical protein
MRMKIRIRGVRSGNSQERRGDWVQFRTEEDFDLRSWSSSLRRDRMLIFCSTNPDSSM